MDTALVLLTLALVLVTAYYAYQTWRMANTMSQQATAAAAAEVARQREAQILDIQPLLIGVPTLDLSKRRASFTVATGSRPVLDLTVIFRGMRSAPDPNSTDGRWATIGEFGSRAPRSELPVRIDVDEYCEPANPTGPPRLMPYEDVWQVELTYHGLLGQWVVETYEWQVRENLRNTTPGPDQWWKLRRLQIVPSAPGASSIDQVFG